VTLKTTQTKFGKAGAWAAVGSVLAAGALMSAMPVQAAEGRPNILFILADNLGYGEVGCYGGGVTRGAATPHIDRLATEGLRLLNMNMETQCTPSRSSILTGRFAIRSGTYAVPFGGVPDGLAQWEVTIAEALSDAGYATALHGKWHLGSHDGRLPNDQGFDEWYGIPRTTDEAMWSAAPNWSKDIVPPEKIMEGRKGEKSRALKDYDVEQRRLIDAEMTRRTVDFMERQAKAGKPFFAYATLTQPHMPTLPNPAFAGKTGNGDWADMLAEMDANVGQMLDAVDRLGVRMEFHYDGGGVGKGGTATLFVNDKKVGEGRIENTAPGRFTADETFDIGEDTGSPVSDAYSSPNRFTGTIKKVEIDTQPAKLSATDQQKLQSMEQKTRLATE